MPDYLSVAEMTEKWGISARRISLLCNQGRIPGAFKIGTSWAIPVSAEKPADQRVKSGKYIKAAGKTKKADTGSGKKQG